MLPNVDIQPAKPNKVTEANLFRHPKAHPIVLDLALLNKYGPEWLEWELETLTHRIPQDFKTPTVSDINIEKIQACRTLHLVDTYWRQWEIFLHCTSALSGTFADFEIMRAPTIADCMISVDIANRIREDVSWSDEVKLYLGVVHRWNDILCVQPPLDFVHIDVDGLIVDCAKVAEMWPESRRSGKPPERASGIEAEQIRRMLNAHDLLEDSRAQFADQVELLRNV